MKNNKTIYILYVIIILELIGFFFSISERGVKIFAYYTQISNIITIISAAALLISYKKGRSAKWVMALRYASSCMLMLTAIITIFVLAPSGECSLGKLLFSPLENGLYHHLLCPLLSITSYVTFEAHMGDKKGIFIPVVATILYGTTLVILNITHLFYGPYPFFKVYEQTVGTSIAWFSSIILGVSLISLLMQRISNKKSHIQ